MKLRQRLLLSKITEENVSQKSLVFLDFCKLFLKDFLNPISFLTVYKKHYPPALNDDVWRLEKIGKDGSFHKRLNNAGIFTVEDFLRLVVRDSQKLRTVSL